MYWQPQAEGIFCGIFYNSLPIKLCFCWMFLSHSALLVDVFNSKTKDKWLLCRFKYRFHCHMHHWIALFLQYFAFSLKFTNIKLCIRSLIIHGSNLLFLSTAVPRYFRHLWLQNVNRFYFQHNLDGKLNFNLLTGNTLICVLTCSQNIYHATSMLTAVLMECQTHIGSVRRFRLCRVPHNMSVYF